jgi:cyclic pyranopterin monophosphate synthase
MSELSHYDTHGKVKMVDVSEKEPTSREAKASARVLVSESTIEAIRGGTNKKGDPLEIARIAGIQGAKRTAELVPLCHQIPLSGIDIEISIAASEIKIEAVARTVSRTGVEMEALTAVSVAALTIYDMLKAVQKDIVITDIRLESKTGGKTDYNVEN